MAAYSSPLRKTVKWYRKLAVELILSTSMVNAYIIYKECTGNKIGIVDFRKEVIRHLISAKEENMEEKEETTADEKRRRSRHELRKKEGRAIEVRKHCKNCYEKAVQEGKKVKERRKVKKVKKFCSGCPNEPFMCIHCFNITHRNI